ncbi:MAG: hypothetical protein VR64_07295 [Desulfatitalea sp. BRH_c12]|nr:MAG: hypothetical protein VR64_07295 [Desulfatitalea sp. BRH_c12]
MSMNGQHMLKTIGPSLFFLRNEALSPVKAAMLEAMATPITIIWRLSVFLAVFTRSQSIDLDRKGPI